MNWKKTRIGDFLNRSKIPVDVIDSKEYKRVTIKIKHNGVSQRDTTRGKKIGTKKQFLLKSGQFIMSKIDARYGAFGIAPDEVDNAIITGNFWAYDVDVSKVNIDWFNQFTNSPDFYELCERASSGITHRKYLDESFFLNHLIDLPSIDEQHRDIKRIQGQKKEFSVLSSELTHQLSLVKQLREAFLREAMQGKLVPQDPSDEPASELLKKIKAEKATLVKQGKIRKEKELPPIKPEEVPFEIPKSWVWCRFADLVDIKSNLVSPFKFPNLPHIAPDNIEKSTGRLLAYQTVFQDKVQSGNHHFYPGQLIYSKVRPKLNKVVKVDFEGLCSADMYPLQSKIDRDFLLYCMLSEFFLKEVDRFDNRVKMPKINQNQLSQIRMPLPPKPEQRRIVSRLEQLMRYCDELEQSINESQKQNEQLLQQVLREALTPKETASAEL